MEDYLNSISDYTVGKLTKEEDIFHTTIIDAEIDPLNCEFTGDNCVKIITKNFGWITLSKGDLEDLIKFIKEVDETN